MTKAARLNLLKDLVQEIDYDIYKGLFVKSCIEEPEEAQEQVDNLLSIIESYDTQTN